MLVWYGAESEVPWLFLLAAWVFGFIAVGGAYAIWNRAGLRLHVLVLGSPVGHDSSAGEVPEGMLRTAPLPGPLFEGDALEIELGLDTTGAARGPAWLSGHVGSHELDAATGLVPKSGWRVTHVVDALARGPVDATAWEIGSSDPLGFFRGRRVCADAEVALVLPRYATLRHRREVRELEASLAAPRSGSGTELFGVREYVSGDALRRIHWRSSARRGHLVVREFEPPGAQSLGILCDPAPPTREVADQIARLAASEAWDCLQDGGRVTLWAPGIEPTSPADSRSFWSLLDWLARYPNGPREGGSGPGAVSQGVWVTAGRSAEIEAAAESIGRRGGGVRGWLVGDGPEPDVDGQYQRVGTAWPL